MIRTCPSCGQRNRIPWGHLADSGRCGKCHAGLPPLAEPLDVGASQLRDIAAAARVPILVDFWAAWCAPCRMSAPEVARVARDMVGRALVLKVDTERHPDLAATYEIRSIPTFLVLRNGAVSFRQSGLARSPQMQAWLDSSAPV